MIFRGDGVVITVNAVVALEGIGPNLVRVYLLSGESVNLNKEDARKLIDMMENAE